MVNNSLKQKSTEEVTITHIVSPDKFFVREVCGKQINLKNVYL